jgi:antibiotic biosynthesis monooxygenase (ABM) superfamily enzyme
MSKKIHIIIKRSGISNSIKHFIDYQNSLTELANKSNGFIKSDTFIKNKYSKSNLNYENSELNIISISQWDNLENWNKFEKSYKRNKIYNNYKELILNESINIYNYKNNYNNTPLL